MTDKKKKKKLKYITLIWEMLPEDVVFYVIPREVISKDDLKMLKACHNNFVGGSGVDTSRADEDTVNRSLCRLNNLLLPDTNADWINDKYRDQEADACGVTREEFDELLGKWAEYKIETDEPRTLPRSRLYRSGFMM